MYKQYKLIEVIIVIDGNYNESLFITEEVLLQVF